MLIPEPVQLSFSHRLISGLSLWLGCFAHSCLADPLQDGLAASQRGDFAEAYCLWRPLAEAGDGEAQYRLAWLYANGQGLRQDPKVAADWWQQAAEQGQVDAQAALGNAYRRGKGRSKDGLRAVRWLSAAARGGNDEAQARLRTMAGAGSKPALAAIDKLVADGDWHTLGKPRRIRANKANLRERPTTSSTIVGSLAKGDEVIVLMRRGDWLHVAVAANNGQTAWIYGRLVATEAQ